MSFLKKLWEAIFEWDPKADDPKQADVILAHAGSETKDHRPGCTNAYLASIVRDLHDRTGLKIIAQGEVANCIRDLPLVGNIPLQRESSDYIDSFVVAKIQKEECTKNGWNRPILVTSKPHRWRAKMVSQKIGLDVLLADVPIIVFDPESKQWWMRSAWQNYPRELACRVVWVLLGKI